MANHANDAMVRRLERELEERNAAASALIENAQNSSRDLNDSEKETLAGLRDRMVEVRSQLDAVESTVALAGQVNERMSQLDQAMTTARRGEDNAVEYRSAGAYLIDSWRASTGDRPAMERLEVYNRVAAHQKTADNLGVIPDPVIGPVVNFIDAARPIVSAIGPNPLTSATWHRPKVTQHTSVDPQGTAGAAADEKLELASQKMTITRLDAEVVTYGGYVNVSRQNIDFSSPQIMDIIVNDLAAQYAIQTEAATAAELDATTTTAVGYGASPTAATVAAAVWTAAGVAYTATKGQGRLVLAVSPDVLGVFGPLFAPVNPQNAQSPGMSAGQFFQGGVGTISGIPVVMSAALGVGSIGDAFLFSTAAIEVYEQRVGQLQAIEPSVLGVQVAYAGYFTPLTIDDDAIVPLTAT